MRFIFIVYHSRVSSVIDKIGKYLKENHLKYNYRTYVNGSSEELELYVLALILRHSHIYQPGTRVLNGAVGNAKL